MQENIIQENKALSIGEALIPVIALVGMLAYNVAVFKDDALSGSNQFVLLIGAAVAAIVGFRNGVSYKKMMSEIGENFKSTAGAIIILLFVGALAGSWLISGIIPAMVYYGVQLLHPAIFLPATVIIAAIISIATGSSWTTSATVGIALVGIGKVIGLPMGMVAGAVISGGYFGDKMSPLSDTTNLAPAMAGAELFDHIRYMMYTTIPSIIITLIVFIVLSLFQDTGNNANPDEILSGIEASFHITPLLFIVPVAVILMIVRKTQPLIALMIGSLLGALFAIIFQPDVVLTIAGASEMSFSSAYMGVMKAMTEGAEVETSVSTLKDLFASGGMNGMLGTIWLIMCAMVFGGIMDAIGALSRISQSLLNMAQSVFGLFASTVASCLALNVTASDQYLAIVVPGKMFAKAYEQRGLAPENLSRTLEDSGTVTSVLIPWNTCGAYQSGVLGVSVLDYFFYAIFNWISPFMTLLFAALSIKIKQLHTTNG
ncbi:MAG: Na+/H+ antiporter NhaC [Bacteroidota bacterium]